MRAVLVVLILGFNCTLWAETGNGDTGITLTDKQISSYGIETVMLTAMQDIPGAGYPAKVVVPNAQLQVVSARQGGLIESVLVAEGDEVTTGQVLARILSPDLLALQRDLLTTLTELNLAKANMDRDKQLMEEGIAPKRRYQESLSVWQALQTERAQQVAVLEYSGMTSQEITILEKTRKLTSKLTVRAPFSGVLLEQMALAGEKLQAADPLFKVGSLKPLWLEIHVPISVVEDVTVGDKVIVPEYDIEGEVITLGRQVHAADQGTLIRALIDNNINTLRPGQFVQVRLTRKTLAENTYLSPATAITRIDQHTIIFIDTEKGFIPHQVDVIGALNNQQIITSSLPISGPVVVSGAVTLKAILAGDSDNSNSAGHGN